MKKSLFVAALAAAIVFAFAASAFAVGPFLGNQSEAAMNPQAAGYVSWSWLVTNGYETAGTPHGNYSTTTNKCQTCHAVHRADPAGLVLTPITGGTDGALTSYTEGCAFCHGSSGTFSQSKVCLAADGTISPHGDCSRCHVASPHGAGASIYAVLSSRLINTRADAAITNDTANSINGLVLADATGMFANTADTRALTLGTGYLCAGCHSTISAPGAIQASKTGHLAFAVNVPNGEPSYDYSGLKTGHQTGHRVWASATTAWNQAGEYKVYYTGGGASGAQSQVAWLPVGDAANSVSGCKSCHDAKCGTAYAFPHAYTDAAQTGASTKSTAGASLVWLTTASNASLTDRAVLGTTGTTSGNDANDLLSRDGLCIKCHISTDGLSGVGINF